MGLFFAAVLMVFAGFFPAQTVESQEQTAALTGVVITKDNTPVQGAMVRLSPGVFTDSTDVSGRFSLTGIPSGNYLIRVTMSLKGFEDVSLKVKIPREEKTPLKIVMHERSYQIDEVVVVSKKQKTGQVKNLPSYVTVIERSEFEDNAATVAEVIAATPSVSINVMGGLGSFSEVSLRGAYSNQVQVYIDGMLLNEAVGGSVNLGTIPLTNVESIEVWRSGAPAQFSGDAVGGAINIRTRDISKPEKSVSLSYGSFNTVLAHGVLSIPHNRSRFLVTVDYASSDNDFKYKSDNGTANNPSDDYWAQRNNDEYRASNLLAKFSHLFGNGVLLEMSEHLLLNKKNLPGTQHIRYSSASLTTTKNLFQARAAWNPFSTEFLKTTPTLHHIYNHEHYEDKGGHVGWFGEQDNIYNTNTFNLMLPVTLKSKSAFSLTVTPTAKNESFRPEHRLERTIPLSCDRKHLALVGDTVIKSPKEVVTITANLRRDRYYSTYEGQINPYVPVPPKPEFHYFTNAQIGLKLKVHRAVSFNGNYGDIWREPGFYELFGDRGGVVSKSGLRPEHIFKWDAGLRLTVTDVNIPLNGSVEFACFENTFNNLIQFYTNNYGFIEPSNVRGSYVRGKEIVWNGNLFGLITCSGNWTFQNSKVTQTRKIYHQGKKLPNRPENYGNLTIEFPIKNVTVFWSVNHKDPYFLDRANQDHKKYPGRTLHDLGCYTAFFNGKTSLRLHAKNITNEHTFDIHGMPKPGRSYMVTFEHIIE